MCLGVMGKAEGAMEAYGKTKQMKPGSDSAEAGDTEDDDGVRYAGHQLSSLEIDAVQTCATLNEY